MIDKIYYITYKTTNIVNDMIYVGAHQTKNLDDGYLGSGTLVKRAIKKYGKENFKKEIISFHDSAITMYDSEKRIINEEFLARDDTYNICLGGFAPPNPKGKIRTQEHIKNQANATRGQKRTEEQRLNISKGVKGKTKGIKKPPRTVEHCNNISKGKKGKSNGPCSEEKKLKIKKANTGRILGTSSRKGTTNIDFYGEEKAAKISQKISNTTIGRQSPRKGIPDIEYFGEERAAQIAAAHSASRKGRIPKNKGCPRTLEAKNKFKETIRQKWKKIIVEYINTGEILSLYDLIEKYNFDVKIVRYILQGKQKWDKNKNQFKTYNGKI